MTVDNYHQINSLISFADSDSFYFMQVIKRRKDNPEMKRESYSLRSYYIKSAQSFWDMRPEVISLCETQNCRAMINLNRKSFKKVSLELLGRLAGKLKCGEYASLSHEYDSICGSKEVNTGDKLWIVDVDKEDEVPRIALLIRERFNVNVMEVKTKAGAHLIIPPVNKLYLALALPNIDIHTNNPTLLYCPA